MNIMTKSNVEGLVDEYFKQVTQRPQNLAGNDLGLLLRSARETIEGDLEKYGFQGCMARLKYIGQLAPHAMRAWLRAHEMEHYALLAAYLLSEAGTTGRRLGQVQDAAFAKIVIQGCCLLTGAAPAQALSRVAAAMEEYTFCFRLISKLNQEEDQWSAMDSQVLLFVHESKLESAKSNLLAARVNNRRIVLGREPSEHERKVIVQVVKNQVTGRVYWRGLLNPEVRPFLSDFGIEVSPEYWGNFEPILEGAQIRYPTAGRDVVGLRGPFRKGTSDRTLTVREFEEILATFVEDACESKNGIWEEQVEGAREYYEWLLSGLEVINLTARNELEDQEAEARKELLAESDEWYEQAAKLHPDPYGIELAAAEEAASSGTVPSTVVGEHTSGSEALADQPAAQGEEEEEEEEPGGDKGGDGSPDADQETEPPGGTVGVDVPPSSVGLMPPEDFTSSTTDSFFKPMGGGKGKGPNG